MIPVYRFAWRPWWIVSHVFVAALVVGMVGLGLWQLRRLDEVKDRNTRLAARLDLAPQPLPTLLGTEAADVGALVDRQVTVSGRYRAEEQVLIRGRSLNEAPGSWVVVPLELDDGRMVAVNRGWISNDGRHLAVPERFAVPDGEVRLTGLLHPAQERGTLGATDPPDGRLDSLARVDLERLDEQVDGDLVPVWVQLTAPEPDAPDPSPEPLGLPVVDDEGPHLSYAGQWFTFSAIAAVGYPIILRKVARERRGSRHPDDGPGLDDPDPDDQPAPGDPRLDAPVPP